jgi:hypothetical protein
MKLSIKKIDRIATQKFNLSTLTADELLDIQDRVLNSCKLMWHWDFFQNEFKLKFYINNVLLSMKFILPFTITASLAFIAGFNLSPIILVSNVLSSIGGIIFGTSIFALYNIIVNKRTEKLIIMNTLNELLANLQHKQYQDWLIKNDVKQITE